MKLLEKVNWYTRRVLTVHMYPSNPQCQYPLLYFSSGFGRELKQSDLDQYGKNLKRLLAAHENPLLIWLNDGLPQSALD